MGHRLEDRMEFDHVVRVLEDGTVIDEPGVFAPECYVYADEDGQVAEEPEMGQGWELLRGYSGQDRYHGPLMHPSEFIGGGLERHILETPGLYVALVVDVLPEGEGERDEEPAGWAVAYRED